MISPAKIHYVFDTLGKHQWGVGWLFSQDGGKWTVNRKRGTGALGVIFSFILTLQITDVRPVFVKESPFPSPSNVTPSIVIDIARLSSIQRLDGNRTRSFHMTEPELISRPRNLKAIPPGAMLSAVLISGASNGVVKAETNEPLIVSGETIIQRGSIILGQGASTEDRLKIKFNQIAFRDGTFGGIDAEACDLSDKIAGLKGSKVGNKALNLAGSLGLNFVGGFSQGLQDSVGVGGVVVKSASLKNALLQGASQTAVEESRHQLEEFKNRVPIIEVSPGQEILILFSSNK